MKKEEINEAVVEACLPDCFFPNSAKEALEKVNKHIDTLKELIRQMEMFEKLKEICGKE